jgi:hypothetical protein
MNQDTPGAHWWLGLCPKAPALHSAPALLTASQEALPADRPDGSGSGRILLGVSIASGSLKTMVHDRQLLVFSFLSGIILFFLVEAEAYNVGHFHYVLPFLITLSIGDPVIVFDPLIFLVEIICLFCFTLVLAGLVLHRNGDGASAPVTVRERFSGVFSYAGPLAVLSVALALLAIMVFAIVYQSLFLTETLSGIFAIFFWPPHSFVLGEMVDRLSLMFLILFISFVPFLVALFLVPAIVQEKKGLVPVLAGSIASFRRTWREMLGCGLVYGTIGLFVAAVALVIGQGPQMLIDNGYLIPMDLGHFLMTFIYTGFIFASLFLMVAVFSAAGIAIVDLSRPGVRDGISSMPEGKLKKPEPAP